MVLLVVICLLARLLAWWLAELRLIKMQLFTKSTRYSELLTAFWEPNNDLWVASDPARLRCLRPSTSWAPGAYENFPMEKRENRPWTNPMWNETIPEYDMYDTTFQKKHQAIHPLENVKKEQFRTSPYPRQPFQRFMRSRHIRCAFWCFSTSNLCGATRQEFIDWVYRGSLLASVVWSV